MAVVVREDRLLVIRRSEHVVAPGAYCFPGGGIEAGETELEALTREMDEELSAEIRPLELLWESVTPWQVHIAWWQAELSRDTMLTPDPAEVASVHWLTVDEMLALDGLLDSNRDFIEAHTTGKFVIEGLAH